MADNFSDAKKQYQTPKPFEYEQPDIESSTSKAADEAFEKRKQAEKQQKIDKEQKEQLSPEEQSNAAVEMSQKKQAQTQKVDSQQEQAARLAATAATSIPVAGGFIKITAFLIRGLKVFFGEQIAGFIAVWIILTALISPLALIPIVGLIFIFVLPPCAALVFTPLLWPKLKPFVEEAGKINPIKK
ncbi:MAG TPA: hypothetical protein P5230_03020 [Candidatus Magasanikbacteria bacterium]|nr:hypothetical protein [Candidatus Magasanikbacteria bacterium]